MPRYFFHIGDTEGGLDPDGIELPDDNSARVEAARTLGVILQDKAGEFWNERCMSLIVTDEGGLILFVLDISALQAPAVTRRA